MSESIKERITRVEEKVSEIASNHLPHLDAKINKISDKQDRGQWYIITTSVGVAITLAVLLLK